MLCENFTSLFFILSLEISRQRESRSGQFIVLKHSANPELVIKIYFNFFPIFFKVLELFECRRNDLNMTANRNFVCFAHS